MGLYSVQVHGKWEKVISNWIAHSTIDIDKYRITGIQVLTEWQPVLIANCSNKIVTRNNENINHYVALYD